MVKVKRIRSISIKLRLTKIISFSLILLICILEVFSINIGAYASAAQNYDKAQILRTLGVFKGTDKGFELDRAVYRVEGAVMLVRLLGKENYALEQKMNHPFFDVPIWANDYIGFMYQTELTKGTGPETYSSNNPMLANEYVTFILRALGYSDKDNDNDFNYKYSLEKAVEIGLLTEWEALELKNKPVFLRDDVVEVSYKALLAKLKGEDKTLIEKLVEDDKAVEEDTAILLGLYKKQEMSTEESIVNETGESAIKRAELTQYGYVVKDKNELTAVLKDRILELKSEFNLDIRNWDWKENDVDCFNVAMENARKEAENNTGIANLVSTWYWLSNTGDSMNVKITYSYTPEEYNLTNIKAHQIVSEIIKPGMTNYGKEKAIHDYIINNTVYDYENYINGTIPSYSHTSYGILVLGKGVCGGYSAAFKLLCHLAGLNCIIVQGQSYSSQGEEDHAWNIVEIDGCYYHIDVTFDDPVMPVGQDILNYYYFNLSDELISRNHKWKREDCPQCNNLQHNYYYLNNIFVNDMEEYVYKLKEAALKKEEKIEIMVKDFPISGYDIPDVGTLISETIIKTNIAKSYWYIVDNTMGIISIYNIEYN